MGFLVFKTSGAALGVARWVRLPCAPAIAFDGVVGGARVVVAARQGAYACTAVSSELTAPDREDGCVPGCNWYAAPDAILGPATGIVQVRSGVWVIANPDSEGTLGPPFDMSDDRATDSSGCPPYSARRRRHRAAALRESCNYHGLRARPTLRAEEGPGVVDTYATRESRALAEARALARLSVAVARASTTRSVAEILLNELFAGVPGATAAVALLDERGGEFELVGVRSASSRPINAVGRWSAELPSPARDVVASGQPLILGSAEYLARYPDVSRISDPSGIARYVALPIIAGSDAIGAVGLSWDDEPSLDGEALAHLQALVDAGAQALGRARLEDAARRSRDIMTAMVDQMPLGVLIVDSSGGPDPGDLRPLYMNSAFLEIFGRRPGMAAGEALPRVLRMDGSPSPEAERPLVRATSQGEVIRDELYRLVAPDESERVVTVNAGPVRSADGTILAGVAVYADVTGRAEAEAARDAFLGVLSHELRTPITSIIAAAEILRRRVGQDPVTADVASGLADDGHRLYRLVENLLVLSRVERGADLRRDDPVLLHHVVRRVVAYAAERWPGRRFELASPPTVPLVAGEDGYVEQILENLLSNAVKYAGDAEPISVVVEEQAGEVRLRVLDRGPGFAEGEKGRAFELFYRDPSAARIAPGAGIGLYVVDALATAMGGRVWACNRDGGGAEVGVGLPALATGHEPARRPARRADLATG